MGWETRRGRGSYYTRSRKVNGRVVREYIGTGLVAELTAREGALARRGREATAAGMRAERAGHTEAEAPLEALCEASDLLVRAALLAAGYRQHHRGEWRRPRDQAADRP